MKILKKTWKLALALVLFGIAALVMMNHQNTTVPNYESQEQTLNTSIKIWEKNIADNEKYKDIQDDLTAAMEALDASRLALYEHFPLELREEDQIMYVLYLESLFGTEIQFSFSSAEYITGLSDKAILGGVVLTVNYQSTYKGFKDMIQYLSSDSRITSLQNATMEYDDETGLATGEVTLVLYIMDSPLLEYKPPVVGEYEPGKDNIFD